MTYIITHELFCRNTCGKTKPMLREENQQEENGKR